MEIEKIENGNLESTREWFGENSGRQGLGYRDKMQLKFKIN